MSMTSPGISGPSPGVSGNAAVRRSWLLVPLSDTTAVEQAWSSGADVILLDLAELVAEVEESEVDELTQLIKEKMEGAADLIVPLQVDIAIGASWYEAK